ncbi:MAG TPA: hypothetical protein VIJ79_07625 [Acidobacteriaceae bacterium]
MLSVNQYENHVAARLLDFFGARTPWQRALWSPGTVLSLKEILEASEAVQAGILTDASLRNLVSATLGLIGPDPGIGATARRQALQRALQSPIRMEGAEYHQIRIILNDVEREYLTNWAAALRMANPPSPERTARAVAAFLLDAGFSAPFLHRWLTYRVEHEPGTRSLADLIDDAVTLTQRPLRAYRILVAFEAAAESKSGMPANWVGPSTVSDWLQQNGFAVSGLRQNGGMWFEIDASDAWSAVEKTVEIVDRLTSRVVLGTNGRLLPLPSAWVEGHRQHFRFGIGPRRVEVHALHREDKLYSIAKGGIVDAALELLGPLNSGSASPAVTGAWAAMEALLSGPGDDDVLAADRMAALVACSFVRAELTALSYVLEESADPIAAQLAACGTNRDRALLTAGKILAEPTATFGSPSDHAAISRMGSTLANPHTNLRDIEGHVTTAFRRLYRQRNLVIHWGKTDAIALNATLRTAAPLVGAGVDRIAHGWFVDGIKPVELAARARIGIDTVGSAGSKSPVDLLSQ